MIAIVARSERPRLHAAAVDPPSTDAKNEKGPDEKRRRDVQDGVHARIVARIGQTIPPRRHVGGAGPKPTATAMLAVVVANHADPPVVDDDGALRASASPPARVRTVTLETEHRVNDLVEARAPHHAGGHQ